MKIFKTYQRLYSPFIGVLVLGLIIFAQHSWLPGMFPDGHLYGAFGKHAVEKGHWLVPHLSLSTYSRFPDHIPFVFILEGIFFKIFGVSYTSMRLFSAFFGIGSLLVLIRLAKQKFGFRVAWWSAFFLATLPPLMKKIRFPGLDLPLMFFGLLCVYYLDRGARKNRGVDWTWAGIFFGLSMLCKGPMAFYLPLGFLLYAISTKQWNLLTNPRAYLSLFLGFAVFGIWPLGLYLAGDGDIFQHYLHSIFSHTAYEGRGKVESSYFTYFILLAKQSPHLLILVVLGFWKRSQLKSIGRQEIFISSFFCALLIPISFFTFKLSHYLIPIFPFWALLAALITGRFEGKFRWMRQNSLNIALVASLVLLIFPLTIESKRDRELQQIWSLLPHKEMRPGAWAIIDHVYPYFNMTNKAGWEDSSEVFQVSAEGYRQLLSGQNFEKYVDLDDLKKLPQFRWGILVGKELFDQTEIPTESAYYPVAFFKHKQMVLLLDKTLLKQKLLVFE
jgi:4-amino-4-deoxy-L-arabinose transferase-like glycosyltransferase